MIARRVERGALATLLAFGAVSAIGGGIALLGGAIDLPIEWLEGSLFSDYTVPALILGIVNGGSQLAALIALLKHRGWALGAAGLAGCVMIGWIIGEIIIVGSEPGLMRQLQIVYLLNGLLEVLLVAWMSAHGRVRHEPLRA